ncbi:MAG: hypothetical protein ACFFBH_02120 [Promethearchaeota archaeon]
MNNVNKRFGIKKVFFNLIYTVTIGIILFFLVIYISFLLSRLIPGDPVLAYLPTPYTPSQYDQMYRQLGLDKPPFQQFILYLGRMFSGNWGISNSINHGMPVTELFGRYCLPRTIDLLLLPLLIGIVLGALFGNLSMKVKHKWIDKLVQILTLVGCALPLFFLGMLFQYVLGYVFQIFPTMGYKTPSYPDPTLITGSRIIDSFLSGQFYLIPDYLLHFVLPWSVLTIGIGSLTALLVRIYLLNKGKRRSIVPNSFNTATSFGLIFGFIVIIETTFGLYGVGQLFIQSIMSADYWVLNSFIFLIPITFVILLVFCNILFIVYGLIKRIIIKKLAYKRSITKKLKHKNEIKSENNDPPAISGSNQLGVRQEKGIKKQFKDFLSYFNKKLLSPLTIFGSIILLFFILISIFPQILTPYTFEQAIEPIPGAWGPPSPLHPFGQTKFGWDVLARVVYSSRTALSTIPPIIGIGLLGGLIIGIPMALLNRRFKMSTEISMIVIFCAPIYFGILVVLSSVAPVTLGNSMLLYGILLIPFFTLLIAKTRINGFEIMKKVIPYIPLFIGFILIIDAGIGFLGFSDPRFISFGNELNESRMFIYNAPWATIWPGLFLFLLSLGFFLLYAGLQKKPRENPLLFAPVQEQPIKI